MGVFVYGDKGLWNIELNGWEGDWGRCISFIRLGEL